MEVKESSRHVFLGAVRNHEVCVTFASIERVTFAYLHVVISSESVTFACCFCSLDQIRTASRAMIQREGDPFPRTRQAVMRADHEVANSDLDPLRMRWPPHEVLDVMVLDCQKTEVD